MVPDPAGTVAVALTGVPFVADGTGVTVRIGPTVVVEVTGAVAEVAVAARAGVDVEVDSLGAVVAVAACASVGVGCALSGVGVSPSETGPGYFMASACTLS